MMKLLKRIGGALKDAVFQMFGLQTVFGPGTGEVKKAKDSRNKLPHPRRGFWIRLRSPAVRAFPRVPMKGCMSRTTSAPNSRRIIHRNRSPHLQIDVAAALAEALICGDQSQKDSRNRSFPSR